MVNEALTRHRSAPASDAGAHDLMLLGSKRHDWRTRPKAALKLGRELARRGEIAYWAVSPEARLHESESADLRAHPRERTRLRSAKLLDGAYRFLCEGRTATGLATVCVLGLCATLRFRPNWRCTSTKHQKCARRRLSGDAGRQSEFDCTRPRQRRRCGLAIGTR
jgi:hypothetical protein